jgi:hypothetical protein
LRDIPSSKVPRTYKNFTHVVLISGSHDCHDDSVCDRKLKIAKMEKSAMA